jgi:hypothetical protein
VILMSTRSHPRHIPPCINSDGVYVDEPYLSIPWDSTNQFVHAEWQSVRQQRGVPRRPRQGNQAIRDHKAAACVSDSRKVKVIGGLHSRTFGSMEVAQKFVSEVPISSG